MGAMEILALIEKGLGIVTFLVQAGRDAEPALAALLELTQGAQKGTISDEDIEALEALLDAQINDFNT